MKYRIVELTFLQTNEVKYEIQYKRTLFERIFSKNKYIGGWHRLQSIYEYYESLEEAKMVLQPYLDARDLIKKRYFYY